MEAPLALCLRPEKLYKGSHGTTPRVPSLLYLLVYMMSSTGQDNSSVDPASDPHWSFADDDNPIYPYNVPYFIVEIVLFVLYSILTGFAVNIFRHRPKCTWFRQWTLLLCALMYLISAAHFCTSIITCIDSCRGIVSPEYVPEQIMVLVNIVISDAIVVLRAWVLWPRNRWVQGFLVLFCLGDIAGLGLGGALGLSAGISGSIASWATNVFTTALISVKAWRHHKNIGVHLGAHTGRTKVEKTLLLFIESGLVYALIWLFIAATYFFLLFEDTYPHIVDIMTGIQQYPMIQLVSIYPMATVVLVDYSNSYFNRALEAETVDHRRPDKNGAPVPQLEASFDSYDGDELPAASYAISGIRYVSGQQRNTPSDGLGLSSAFITQTSAL